jgi:hypothetical protein
VFEILWKKWWGSIWNIILSFCITILQKSCKYWKQLQICFHCDKPYWGGCVHSSSISVTAKCAAGIALQKAPFKKHPLKSTLQSSTSTFLHEMKIECIYRVLLPNWLQWLIFTISSGRRGYEKLLQPWSFPHEERSHMQDCNQTMWEIWFRAFL